MLGTGFQPRRKREVIHGPLISAIPDNEDGKNKAINRSSMMIPPNSTNEDIIGQSLQEMIFQDGLLGQKKAPVNAIPGNGPLISAIPINKEEVKPVNTLDQGLVGKMQSREAYLKSKTVSKDPKSRNSENNPTTTTMNHNIYQSYYGYQNPLYNGQNYSSLQVTNEMNINSNAFSPYANQGVNSQLNTAQVRPMGYIPIEYQQAFMYQQYQQHLYALEVQNRSKEKKKSKKKKDKKKDKKKKESIAPVIPPHMVNYYMQGYMNSTYPGPAIHNVSEPIARPAIVSSSEESDESA